MHANQATSIRLALIDSFAEVSVCSAHVANALMDRYPGYRQALDDPSDSFWSGEGVAMLAECQEHELRLVMGYGVPQAGSSGDHSSLRVA